MTGYVYILRDLKGKFYVGSTNNLERRVKAHMVGHTQTTRNMIKPELVFTQNYKTLKLARGVERRIKKLKRKDYIEKIIKDGYIRLNVT